MAGIKFKKENLGVIVPQRSAINASADDLAGKFKVQDIVPRRGFDTKVDMTEDKSSDDIGSLLVRLKSEKGRFFTLSMRQFFSLPLAATAMSKEEVEAEMDGNRPSEKMKPLYNSLLDATEEELELPETIEFVYIADRMTETEPKKRVYPAGLYPEFQERAQEMEAANIKDRKKGKTEHVYSIMDV